MLGIPVKSGEFIKAYELNVDDKLLLFTYELNVDDKLLLLSYELNVDVN
jgi:hypothetical protein